MENDNISLRDYIKERFDVFSQKLDYILNPKTGIYKELMIVNQKVTAAHTRIDRLEKKREKKGDVLVKIVITLISLSIGFMIKLLWA